MRPTTSGAAFAAANAAMTRGVDSASTVHVLLGDCVSLLGADAAGVLVRSGGARLDILATTSHQALELELHQVAVNQGPCVEAARSGVSVRASGEPDLTDRWPGFGGAMAAAGLRSVHASPMRWHGQVVGGFNLFWEAETTLTREQGDLAQAFADLSTVALMQPGTPARPADVAERLRVALQGRVAIERAKGVLAHHEGVGMDEAFQRLLQRSDRDSRSLAQVARDILDEATTRRG